MSVTEGQWGLTVACTLAWICCVPPTGRGTKQNKRQEHGAAALQELEPKRLETQCDSVFYLVRPTVPNMQAIAAQVQRCLIWCIASCGLNPLPFCLSCVRSRTCHRLLKSPLRLYHDGQCNVNMCSGKWGLQGAATLKVRTAAILVRLPESHPFHCPWHSLPHRSHPFR